MARQHRVRWRSIVLGVGRAFGVLLLMTCLMFSFRLQAQVPQENMEADSASGAASTSSVGGIEFHKEPPDSVLRSKIYFFRYRPAHYKIDRLDHPTLNPTGVQFADMLDAFNGNYYLGKGTVGHPHYALFPLLGQSLDVQLQPDPIVGYAKRAENIRLFQAQSPYTMLGYHSSLDKDYVVKVTHTQNLRPGWNAAIDYRLICPEGVYLSSGATDHFLDISTNYFSADSRLQARGGIIRQSLSIDENGGIADDTYFTQQRQSNRAGIPVNFSNSGSTYKEFAAFGGGAYNLVRQVEHYRQRDSIVARVIDDTTTIFDTLTLTDTIAVGSPKVLNLGMLGVDINYDYRKRVFTDSTDWRNLKATLFWTNDVYPDHRWINPIKVTLGVQPHIVAAVIEGDTMKLRSWLDPFARGEVALGRHRLYGEADVRASFSEDDVPDSRFVAGLDFAFDSLRRTRLRLEGVQQRKMPDLRMIYDQLMLNLDALRPIVSQHLGLTFSHREVVDLELKASHLSHNTWYDSLMTVCEGNNDLWLYQGRFNVHLQWKAFHADLQQLVQFSTDSLQLPVPLLASKNSFYADLHLFRRAVRMQLGADLRYHSPFFAPAYDHATGLFYHQDQQQVGGYLWADVFINLQVKRACFYVKGGHLNALWDTSPNYFILPHYPGRKFGVYWGIEWHFFD